VAKKGSKEKERKGKERKGKERKGKEGGRKQQLLIVFCFFVLFCFEYWFIWIDLI